MLSVAKLISSAASSLQSGNPLQRVYQLDENSRCHGGPYLKWQAIQARHFERNEEVTLFLFDKKVAEKLSKREQDLLYDLLRADAANLQRLRHPIVLPLLEPLNEDKSSLAFATRPTTMTLYGLLKGTKSRPSVLEMKYGLLDTCEALAFLHQDAKMAHLAVSPYSIFISRSGRWALGCLGHSKQVSNSNLIETQFTFERVGGQGSGAEFSLDPPLSYSAPEMTAHHPARCGLPSDVYSLGLVAYEVLSEGTRPLLHNVGYDTSAHRSQCKSVLPLPRSANLPRGAPELLRGMLASDPLTRPSISDVLQNPFFQDINVKALRFIVALREKDANQKTQFLRGLRKLLEEQTDLQDERVLRLRVLEPLLEFICESNLRPALLPNIVFILKRVGTPLYFQDIVWPKLQPLLTAREIQIDCVLQLIDELPMLVEFGGDAVIKSDLVPFALKCLQIQEVHIQQALFTALPVFGKKIDYMILRTGVLPRMLSVVTETESSSVRACGIRAAIEISDNFDRATLLDQVIPMMEKVIKLDRSPLVSASLRYSVEKLLKRLGNKVAAERVIPLLTRLLAEENLSQPEFDSVMQLTIDILNKVKSARSKEFAHQTECATSVSEALGVSSRRGLTPHGHDRGLESLLFESTPPRASQSPESTTSNATHLNALSGGSTSRRPSRTKQPKLENNPNSLRTREVLNNDSLLDLSSVLPSSDVGDAMSQFEYPTSAPVLRPPVVASQHATAPSGHSTGKTITTSSSGTATAVHSSGDDPFAGLIVTPPHNSSEAYKHQQDQRVTIPLVNSNADHTSIGTLRNMGVELGSTPNFPTHPTSYNAQQQHQQTSANTGATMADPFSSLANFNATQNGSVTGAGTHTKSTVLDNAAWSSAFAGLDKAFEERSVLPSGGGQKKAAWEDDLSLLM
eukprot:Lankesteria_metandrocarpae@DN3646_c0_g1_i1.p1